MAIKKYINTTEAATLTGRPYDEVLIIDPETPITREEYEKEDR